MLCAIGRRIVTARRQDGREREGGRGRVERRREEDETHASWRHRCQSRPPRGRAFLGKWITGQFFASQECVKRAMLDDSLQSWNEGRQLLVSLR